MIPDLAGRDDEPSVIVQSGQTLSELASEHLGDAGHWPELAAANPGLVTDPDVIDIGWRLKLPTPADLDTRTAQAPAADPQIDTTPLNLEPCPIPPVGQNQPGESAAADQAGPQMTVAALGAGAITALAGLFFLRRRRNWASLVTHFGTSGRTPAPRAYWRTRRPLPAVPLVTGKPGAQGENALGWSDSTQPRRGEFCCDIEGEQSPGYGDETRSAWPPRWRSRGGRSLTVIVADRPSGGSPSRRTPARGVQCRSGVIARQPASQRAASRREMFRLVSCVPTRCSKPGRRSS